MVTILPSHWMMVTILSSDWFCSWEAEGCLTVIPGNPRSVARQFLRVMLQQLSTNSIFPSILEIPSFHLQIF